MKGILISIISTCIIIFTVCIYLAISTDTSKWQEWDKFDNAELKTNIEKAFEEINLQPDKISKIIKVSNWANGPRYRVAYEEKDYYIYALDNNQVSAIKEKLTEDSIYTNNNIKFETESDEILLKEGEYGEYGKDVTFDGKKYIKYFLPEGEYTARALVSNAMFYILDTKIYKNSFGHDESETLETIMLKNVGDEQNITIKSNNCVSLVIGTSIALKKTEQ